MLNHYPNLRHVDLPEAVEGIEGSSRCHQLKILRGFSRIGPLCSLPSISAPYTLNFFKFLSKNTIFSIKPVV
ncbi:unnamed protein product, partial [Nesidiocoris tenuis]